MGTISQNNSEDYKRIWVCTKWPTDAGSEDLRGGGVLRKVTGFPEQQKDQLSLTF